jgi:hypothetical protein
MKRVILFLILAGSFTPEVIAATRLEIEVPLTAPQESGPPPVYQEEPPPVYEPLSPPVAPPAPPPAVEGYPAPVIPPFSEPPLMVWDPKFGMYFAFGTPYDIFFYGGYYYLFFNGGWHRSLHYNGPWFFTQRGWLPPVFLRYGIEGIRHYREEFYRDYHRHPEAFRDRRFDHREDRYKGAYDRGFVERNRERMKNDREIHERYNRSHENR